VAAGEYLKANRKEEIFFKVLKESILGSSEKRVLSKAAL
jgi:hypothetical protein